MRAVTYSAYSTDNSNLEVREVDPPKVAPGSVLIEVRAAGVNPVDWQAMAGELDSMIDTIFPVIPGWDVAGTVIAVGLDTPEFSVGDEVMAYASKDVLHAGTYAEQVAVPARSVARKPSALSWVEAGGLPIAGGTALRTLDRVGLAKGETVLIHGAAGGVGSMAVQIAVARGARVIGTASPRNHEFLVGLGAEPVAYRDGLADRVRALAPDGVDAVADLVGGHLESTLAVLRPGGRHASIADGSVLEHGGSIVWVQPDGTETARLAALVEAGKLRVEVAATFTLDQVGEAFNQSRTAHTRGKLIITP